MTPEDLLWRHTVFPYATAMMQRRYYENAVEHVYGQASVAGRLAPVMQNVTCGLGFRRFCPQCVIDDLARWHESYWHRTHHLPGVLVCARHQCFLRESALPIQSSGPFPKTLPHEDSGRVLGRGQPSAFLLAVAQISAQWLDRPPGPGALIDPSGYRALAIKNGWLSPTREVNVLLMASALKGVASDSYFARSGVPLSAKSGFWAAMMLRPGTTLPFTPLKHAVMQALLAKHDHGCAPPLDHHGGGPRPSAANEMDDLYSREASKELRRVLRQGSVLTTEQFLRGAGCWGAYHHRMGELPKLRAVVREFRGSAATVKRLRLGKQLYRLPNRES